MRSPSEPLNVFEVRTFLGKDTEKKKETRITSVRKITGILVVFLIILYGFHAILKSIDD